MLARRALATLALSVPLLFAPLPTVAGQAGDATPTAGGDRADLAAMTLDSEDLPEDYFLRGERYITGENLVAGLDLEDATAEALTESGLTWFYESTYTTADGAGQIRSYVSEYPDEAGAEAGFGVLEDEEALVGEGGDLEDQDGPAVGEDPKEITVGSLPPNADADDDAPALRSVDATFRVGTLIVGVAVETRDDAEPDQALAEELADVLATRVEDVLAGQAPATADPAVREALLQLDAGLSVQEGYLTATDVLGPVDPADTPYAEYDAGYALTLAIGDGGTTLPYVSLAVSSFSSEDGPLAVLGDADNLQPAFTNIERVDDVLVEGADAAVGYRFASTTGGRSENDSFRILIIVGDRLATVDVQGATSAEVAEAAALDLAGQQAECLQSDDPCGAGTIPVDLETAPSATPEAEVL
ncbi:MAG: hypothetical protein AVDCRST_MAG73-2716 [uncultured Thermomicrobiales bacterium]|uniref:Uncharacterized protein n=1 Tax=uncultured Thermomicrobiales bacterium TaxID=1645740 RepID=A0A6J4UF84_9BACT|nr:MAG: hypothetical protein AVDCRST_MAG73-2716 [uncultured Thermomicrobiales bacterium]